jgi:chromosome segregation ATPase
MIGDLTQKSREFDLKNLELKEIINRLHLVEESNSDSSETKDSLSVEIKKIRSELFTTQQLLRQKEEELLKTEEELREVDAALNAALSETESVAESSKNLLMPEIHNLRAKLNAIEIEYENSRAHASELDRARCAFFLFSYYDCIIRYDICNEMISISIFHYILVNLI